MQVLTSLIVFVLFFLIFKYFNVLTGKARRLKQAKEEAQAEVEAYRRERERQYKEHEQKVAICIFCSRM